MRDVLVVAQIAVALMLTVSAALLARSFVNITGSMRGFGPSVSPPFTLRSHAASIRRTPRSRRSPARSSSAWRGFPGVRAVGMVNRLPLAGGASVGVLQVENSALADDQVDSVDWRSVTPGYFGRWASRFAKDESSKNPMTRARNGSGLSTIVSRVRPGRIRVRWDAGSGCRLAPLPGSLSSESSVTCVTTG